MATTPLVAVENLWVRYDTPKGPAAAVRGVSFELGRERLGIVGESGSGKSQTARAILGLTAPGGRIDATRLELCGVDLLHANVATLRRLRGQRATMVLQDPKYSLNPVLRVGTQIMEALRGGAHTTRRQARAQTLAMLRAVRIRDPERVFRAYPHELSGGMGQRVMLAMMMIAQPKLLIADEPTSALDVTVQQQVLSILDDMVSQHGMGLILISHDLELVASFCDRVLVLYAGRVMEVVDARRLHEATHPYTRGLLGCLPRIEHHGRDLPVLQRDATWLEHPDRSD